MSTATVGLAKLQTGVQRARLAFDTRVRRERVLMLGAAVALIWMLADTLWLTPAFKDWSTARAKHATIAGSLQQLNEQIARTGAESRAQEQQLSRDLVQWRERVQTGDAALRDFGGTLVKAADMLPVLDGMLSQAGGLKLRAMHSLGRTELVAAASAGAAAASAPKSSGANTAALYRHGVELTVEGSFADLLAYLRALEAMPQRVLWGGMQLKVEQHPKAVLTLRLYTLSLDRSWLEI